MASTKTHSDEVAPMSLGRIELAKRAAVAGSVVLLLVVSVIGVGYAFDVIMLGFTALLFAILLRGMADYVNRYTHIGEQPSTGVAVLLVLAVVIGTGWFLAPRVTQQTEELRQTLPKSMERLKEQVNKSETGRWLMQQAPQAQEWIPRRGDWLARITGFASTALSAVGAIFIVFFMGVYLAAQPRMYVNGFVRLIPPDHRGRARDVLGQIGAALQWWLFGKFVAMVFVGVLVWLMLWLLGLPYALVLGVIAALLTFIPNFGPVISAIPAVLVALMDSPMTAVWVIVLFTAIQGVESYILTPLIQQSTLDMPAALIILVQLIMGVLAGGIGLALATPLVLVLMVLIRTLYIEDILGETEPGDQP